MNNSTISFGYDKDISIQTSYTFKALMSVAISFVALLSVLGNILVIITFVKAERLRTSANYYITSMAVSDLLFVATEWPLFSRSRFSVFGESLSTFQCKIVNYFGPVSYTVSTESLVLITVDRYIAVVFPLKVGVISGRIRALFILLSWTIPVVGLVPYSYFSRSAKPDELFLCPTDSGGLAIKIYYLLGFVFLYCAPLIIIITLSVRIMKTLRRTNPVIQGNGHSNRIRLQRNQRIMKILISIMVSFLICWTLYYMSKVLLQILDKVLRRKIQEMVHIISYFLPYLSTAVNPLILFTFSTNYRQGLKDCLCLAVVKCGSCFVHQQVAREENVEIANIQ